MTVGVCVKDSEKTIKECIDSIVNQKYPQELSQIIIVDGCSKDKTLPIVVSSTSKADILVEIYSDEGRGLGAARQIIVDHANGKYLIFVDADVKLFDDFVKKHVKFMEENPDVGIAFGKPMHQEARARNLVSTVLDLFGYATGGFIGTDATIFRTRALTQVGGFDTNIRGAAEDIDLITRIQAKGWLSSTNENARFFHEWKNDLRGFWNEQSWFGYGDHYIHHKHRNIDPAWHKLPVGVFVYGLRMARKAYGLTHREISFLIPLQMVFGNIAWWSGFIKGHIDGYGHQLIVQAKS